MKYSLGISNFLEEISRSLCFPLFLCIALITEEGLLISPCYSLEFCIQMGISFLFPFAFHFPSFHSYLQGLVRQPFCFFCISFSWQWSWFLSPVQCHELLSIVHQALCLPDLVPTRSIFHFHCIVIRDLIRSSLNGLVVFSTFFNFSLNLAIRSSWSEPQSDPSLVFADCIELHFGCKEYKQSDFGVDHLVISMCRVFSYVVGRRCFLWPVHSLVKALLVFVLLHSVLQGQICLLLQVFLDFLLLHSSPL